MSFLLAKAKITKCNQLCFSTNYLLFCKYFLIFHRIRFRSADTCWLTIKLPIISSFKSTFKLYWCFTQYFGRANMSLARIFAWYFFKDFILKTISIWYLSFFKRTMPTHKQLEIVSARILKRFPRWNIWNLKRLRFDSQLPDFHFIIMLFIWVNSPIKSFIGQNNFKVDWLKKLTIKNI